ncbi:hypothetical protein ACN28C_15635 [Plantactinospora sp. WMMC1484]|uniref:hypothetical protein n=1 Tax=Plantactinospora sp. WMMC1484 TaxID=3404122 RepID=UPI003BF487A5
MERRVALGQLFPGGEWGRPGAAARLVGFLCSPDGRRTTGQGHDSAGGSDRYA